MTLRSSIIRNILKNKFCERTVSQLPKRKKKSRILELCSIVPVIHDNLFIKQKTSKMGKRMKITAFF